MNRILFASIVFVAGCASQTEAPPPPLPSPAPVIAAPEPTGPIAAPEPVFERIAAPERCQGEGYHCVRVIYGTNRDRLPYDPAGQRAYGTEPETLDDAYEVPAALLQLPTTTRLETGEVIVTIPALHEPGDAIRRKRSETAEIDEDDRSDVFSFLRPPEPFYTYRGFSETVGELFANADDRDALLHIHGFNVSFRSGAFRAAQLKSDTGFEGPVFYFSWPSNARLREYFNDQVDGDVSARALANFLVQIQAQIPEGGELHVIAHSMGTRVFSQAVALLRDNGAWSGVREAPDQP
ncbi:MAG: alpha/beta hydrolase, partial [Pseudomonadota bacterium]